MATKKILTPALATHPGVLIKDELDATPDLNQRKLAKELDVKPSFLNYGALLRNMFLFDISRSINI